MRPWAQGTNVPDGVRNLALSLHDVDGMRGLVVFETDVPMWQNQIEEQLGLWVELKVYDAESQSMEFRQAQSGTIVLDP